MDGSSLNHFDFVYIPLCIWAPHRGGVFKLGSNNGFISSFANSRVFCFYVTFNETQWLIYIWGNFVNELKFMLVDKSTPRCLAADTLSRVWLCIVYEGFMGALALVMWRTWHLLGLNSISHFTSHRCYWSKSFWRSDASLGWFIVRYTAVSSANRQTCDCTLSGRSFMYNRNKIGPRTDPCGTPEETGTSSEHSPSSTTDCVLPTGSMRGFYLEHHASVIYKVISGASPCRRPYWNQVG